MIFSVKVTSLILLLVVLQLAVDVIMFLKWQFYTPRIVAIESTQCLHVAGPLVDWSASSGSLQMHMDPSCDGHISPRDEYDIKNGFQAWNDVVQLRADIPVLIQCHDDLVSGDPSKHNILASSTNKHFQSKNQCVGSRVLLQNRDAGFSDAVELTDHIINLNTNFEWMHSDGDLLKFDLQSIVMHELGHALGLSSKCVSDHESRTASCPEPASILDSISQDMLGFPLTMIPPGTTLYDILSRGQVRVRVNGTCIRLKDGHLHDSYRWSEEDGFMVSGLEPGQKFRTIGPVTRKLMQALGYTLK